MFSTIRTRIAFAVAIVLVLAAAVVPAAGARTEPTSPWYAYDAAVRKAQDQRHAQQVKSQLRGIATSPWYAYDAGLRKLKHQRAQRSAQHVITDTLGGNGGAKSNQAQ